MCDWWQNPELLYILSSACQQDPRSAWILDGSQLDLGWVSAGSKSCTILLQSLLIRFLVLLLQPWTTPSQRGVEKQQHEHSRGVQQPQAVLLHPANNYYPLSCSYLEQLASSIYTLIVLHAPFTMKLQRLQQVLMVSADKTSDPFRMRSKLLVSERTPMSCQPWQARMKLK